MGEDNKQSKCLGATVSLYAFLSTLLALRAFRLACISSVPDTFEVNAEGHNLTFALETQVGSGFTVLGLGYMLNVLYFLAQGCVPAAAVDPKEDVEMGEPIQKN